MSNTDRHNLHTPDPRNSRPPSTPERLTALEQRQDDLENTIMSAIRDLAMNVNQMHRTQMNALQHGQHHHEQAPTAPVFVFTFLEALSHNTMYRIYLDGPDHAICPNGVNIHTRREGTDLFDALPVEPALDAMIMDAFIAQVGTIPNKLYFIEVHGLSDARIDDTSVPVGEASE